MFNNLRFENLGGIVMKKTIDSFDDTSLLDYDLLVNCTGFGAKHLCGDDNLVPIRGQVFKVLNLIAVFVYKIFSIDFS